ncbi:MAG: hypothetical protein M3063_07960 [Actinomycetota bacterium]|nr:hypothetical protein [Actinomycetota bacterium]
MGRQLPDEAAIVALNEEVADLVSTSDGASLLRRFSADTATFLFVDLDLLRPAWRLIGQEVGVGIAVPLTDRLPGDLLADSPVGLERFLRNLEYSDADIARALATRAAKRDVIGLCHDAWDAWGTGHDVPSEPVPHTPHCRSDLQEAVRWALERFGIVLRI